MSCFGVEGVRGSFIRGVWDWRGCRAGEWFCAECEQQGTYLQSVKTGGDGYGAVNGGDVVMGGMEDGEKGKGKERAVVEVDGEGGSSTTATADGSSLHHSSISTGE